MICNRTVWQPSYTPFAAYRRVYKPDPTPPRPGGDLMPGKELAVTRLFVNFVQLFIQK